MRSVLAIYFTQSGQLEQITHRVTEPLLKDGRVSMHYYEIQMEEKFPFPWNKDAFFDVFPESFTMEPRAIKPPPLSVQESDYDLIFLFYQVWYLSPSIPISSFLQSEWARKLMSGKPVVTISGSRNMWFSAQEKVKKLLAQNQAELVGNVALVDRAPNLTSVVTIVDWMFTGEKRRYLGIFPMPGVSHKDIWMSSRFGVVTRECLHMGSYAGLQEVLVKDEAVKISPYLLVVDRTGSKIFSKWAPFILKRRKTRRFWLKAFYWYLFCAIWIISPIVYILHAVTYPFKAKKFEKQIRYFQGIK